MFFLLALTPDHVDERNLWNTICFASINRNNEELMFMKVLKEVVGDSKKVLETPLNICHCFNIIFHYKKCFMLLAGRRQA